MLSPEDVDFSNKQDWIFYLATKLTFLAGLRNGDVCGLFVKDVKDLYIEKESKDDRHSYLEVCRQWSQRMNKRTLVKDKDTSKIPIFAELRGELNPLLPETVGIADRVERYIAFHSARRFFNTLLRHERVADDVIRRFTGHDSQEMIVHYTDYLPEDLQVISQAQSRLLFGGIKE